ncbi:hypothetical protein PspLS_04398 [Pyricularia sp. CBS 133598]|nr:hypothetical protein PspLS_04398 [Pyricularia sp. CBS 133598]
MCHIKPTGGCAGPKGGKVKSLIRSSQCYSRHILAGFASPW